MGLDDSLRLRDFAQALVDADFVEDETEILKKPYKFDPEFELWSSCGHPQEGDAGWKEFVEALNDAAE